MFSHEVADNWDKGRLLDFGFQTKNVVPAGLSLPYASSELLQAGIALHAGGHPGDCLISGSAADMWAIGSLLFYMVNGEYPFVCDVMLHGGRNTPACHCGILP
ncbi:TPA: Serine/threonine-protein kinase NIM1 [Trebouxia sp. C0006]